MDIDTLYRAENLAVEASYTVFDVLDDRNEPASLFFHVNHIRRTDGITVAATGTRIEIDINNHWLRKDDGVSLTGRNHRTAQIYHVRSK
jgi:hypothetical protein